MRNKIPNIPPSSELMNTSIKFTVSSGYLACKMYKAGKVKIAPATITPEQAPMDWIITFSPNAFFRLAAPDSPTAIMAIGMAASNTWPTFKPKNAAAAEKITAMTMPHETDHALTSG